MDYYSILTEINIYLYSYIIIGCLVGVLLESMVKKEDRLPFIQKIALIGYWPFALWILFKD